MSNAVRLLGALPRAMCRGAEPAAFRMFGSASSDSSALATTWLHSWAARQNGVLAAPSAVAMLMSACLQAPCA
jgi:hypothetical protein